MKTLKLSCWVFVLKLRYKNYLRPESLLFIDFNTCTSRLRIFIEEIIRLSKNNEDMKSSDDDTKEEPQHTKIWDLIREDVCQPTTNVLAAYILALVCRSISLEMKAEEHKTDEVNDLFF